MKPMKTLLIAFALSGACGSVAAVESVAAAAGPGAEADVTSANGRTRAGFFVVPSRPVAYSFADICNLTIEPKPLLAQPAASPFAAAGLASFWARTDRPRPVGTDGESDAPSAAEPAQPEGGEPLLPVTIPEPAGWMGLCGIAIVALIVKRRRDWSARRGLPFGKGVPMRTRDAGPQNPGLVRPD